MILTSFIIIRRVNFLRSWLRRNGVVNLGENLVNPKTPNAKSQQADLLSTLKSQQATTSLNVTSSIKPPKFIKTHKNHKNFQILKIH